MTIPTGVHNMATVTSGCTGCDLRIASPAWHMNLDTVWVFREFDHGCGGRAVRLVPLMTVYSAPPKPEPKRHWWQRKPGTPVLSEEWDG